MLEIFSLIFPLFGLILLGYLSAKITGQSLEALGWLNTFIIYLALPALFFRILSKTPIEQLASWEFIVTNIAVTFLVFLFVFSIGFFTTQRNIADSTIQGLAGAYGNIGYMGPALAILALGEKAAIPVALIFCFENVMHFSIAPCLMAISGKRSKETHRLFVQVIKSILLHPFIIATIFGVLAAYFQLSLPQSLSQLMDYLAQSAAPCALFAMGVTLALRPLNRIPGSLSYVVPTKLILHPLAMYLALSLVGDFDPLWVFSAVLLASLPTATNVFVLAQQYQCWVERASASVLISTVISVLTVSLLLYLISHGLLPEDYFPG